MGILTVAENLRRRGIGTKLVEALASLAIEDNITILGGNTVSAHAVHMLTKLAGSEDGITFYDQTPRGESLELPMDSQQARSSLMYAEAFESNLDKRRHGIDIAIALNPGQRFGLEAPIMLNSPHHIKLAYR